MPWTYTWVVRKMQQVESFKEIPREKRPPSKILWWGTAEELDEWLDRVFDRKGKRQRSPAPNREIDIVIDEIE